MSALGVFFEPVILAVQDLILSLFIPSSPSPVSTQSHPKTLSLDLVRPEDLLVVRVDGYNLRLDEATRQLLADGPGNSFLIFNFPAQHVAEAAFMEVDANDQILPPPVPARAAGESRIVVHLGSARLPLELSAEALLAALSASVPLVGDRTGAPPLAPDMGGSAWFGGGRSQRTAIEAPWRLTLSPHPNARWAHALKPVSDGPRTELWHSRLGVAGPAPGTIDERSTIQRTVRAIHSADFTGGAPPTSSPSPFLTSLTRKNRHQIVRLSSERSLAGNAPVAAERLHLSALGGELSLRGHWHTEEISLVDWEHLATLGRDHFVKTVEKGFLFPLGHRAALITITERKISRPFLQDEPVGGPQAYLRQRKFVVLREPVKLYGHRAFPFRTVAFRTMVTPNLFPEATDLVGPSPPGGPSDSAFWPKYSDHGVKADVLFEVEGTDWAGETTVFHAPQIFVFDSTAANPAITSIVKAYNGAAGTLPALPESSPRRTRPMGGGKIAFAPQQRPGDTSLDSESLTFAALDATGTPAFLPAMRGAQVSIPAVREMTGSAAAQTIRYEKSFLDAAPTDFGNFGEVFARIESPPPIAFPIEKTGGLVAPNLTPQGLSRAFGPVGDVAAFVTGGADGTGEFDPGVIFKDIKILGGIPLDKIFQKVRFDFPAQAGTRVPGLTSTRTETRYIWEASAAELQPQDMFKPLAGAAFKLDSRIAAPVDGAEAAFEVTGRLEKFEIVLPPGDDALVGASFDHVSFSAGSGRKLDVSVQFSELTFKNELSFVNDIRKYIPLDGFIDPPYLDISPQGISSGYTLGIPTIGVGIFVLQDISLSAGFHLPFVGGAAGLRFAFCERDHPFLLTVMAIGGGGFFALELDTSEVTSVEAALEFGAAVAINLGIASGKASITGGVYYQKSGENLQFSAYFRAAGSLSVLGIITVSVELYIALEFKSKQPDGGTLSGTASVKVKIKIAFFSKTVSVSMTRELAGSDPTFAQMISPKDWADYCGAFAAEP